MALATLRDGAIYPASTVNGGTSWRIDGPRLYERAAQAPGVVTEVGAAPPKTYLIWGGPDGGGSVDVSDDGGQHWWQAFLGDVVLAAVGSGNRLVTIAQSGSATHAVSHVYVSTDGGRHWRATSALGASVK